MTNLWWFLITANQNNCISFRIFILGCHWKREDCVRNFRASVTGANIGPGDCRPGYFHFHLMCCLSFPNFVRSAGQGQVQMSLSVCKSKVSLYNNQFAEFMRIYAMVLQIAGSPGTANSVVLEIENGACPGPTPLHKLSCLRSGNSAWETILTSKITAVCGNRLVSKASEIAKQTLCLWHM